MIREAIRELADRRDLDAQTAAEAMREIMRGEANDAAIAAYLMGLRCKGETVEEITASATVLRELCERVPAACEAVDIVGTGGDMANTFNISTAAMFITAGAGGKVAKHGNRSASSECGAADVIEAMGGEVGLNPQQTAAVFEKTGICFMFAPVFHASMKYAAPVRRQLGIRTLFNILGPLANPAYANYEVLGVYDAALLEPLARVLVNLGVKSGAVVHGGDGIDEATVSGSTEVCEIVNGSLSRYTVTPESAGLTRRTKGELRGGSPAVNAAIMRSVLAGEASAYLDASALNAAFALKALGLAADVREGVLLALKAVKTGAAAAKAEAFIAATLEA